MRPLRVGPSEIEAVLLEEATIVASHAGHAAAAAWREEIHRHVGVEVVPLGAGGVVAEISTDMSPHDIYPRRGKVLRFSVNGTPIFRSHVRAVDPAQFVGDAIEKATPQAEETARRSAGFAASRITAALKV